MQDTLFRLSIHTGPAFAAVLEEALPAAGFPAAVWTDAETGACRVDLYAADRPEADRQAATLEPILRDLCRGENWSLDIAALAREDWAESWKRFFHAERVSARLVVRPSWETFALQPGDHEIVLDAGMCFGTGRHATTRACLRFLDALAADGRPGPLLDAGCGSGILAIAAVKLGLGPVTAIDLDPLAVSLAAENAARNRVDGQARFEAADVLRYAPAARFPVVAANIEAPVLIAAADTLVNRLAAPQPGAALLLAGILDRQYGEVRAAFEARGFAEQRRETEDGWTSGWFTRAP